ncbi:MAG: hypothetical protein O3B86_10340 [Planctomycetota bacterium]|nr:hypothetical protein [Planctomycetota bacterium]
MITNGADWGELKSAIIAGLDIPAEYQELGIKFPDGAEPRSNGWLACFAAGREDKSPSAAINVTSGHYRDLGGDNDSLSLWDFAAKYGPFADWKEAFQGYAKKSGVQLPHSKKRKSKPTLSEKVEILSKWNPLSIRGFRALYPSVTEDAIRATGATLARYPGWSHTPRYCLAWPIYGSELFAKPPIGYVLQAADGGLIEVVRKGCPSTFEKRITVGESGLVGTAGLKAIAKGPVERIYKVEGISDLLALESAIPAELREKHIVITNAGGAGEHKTPSRSVELLKDACVVLIHDSDLPGQNGAKIWLDCVGVQSRTFQNVVLHEEIAEKNGKDIRDWLGEHSYDDLCELVSMTNLSTPDALKPKPVEQINPIRNGLPSGEGGGDPLPINEIVTQIQERTGGWPKRCGPQLFTLDGSFLTSSADLFAWLGSSTGLPVMWYSFTGCVTKPELYSRLQRDVEEFEAIESLPHVPLIQRHFYLCGEPPDGDGSALSILLDFFSPETLVDRALIQAMLATPLWGGGGGQRPAFLLTSDFGRGVGKTALASALARLYRGMISIDSAVKMDDFKKRLLSPDAAAHRVVLADNLKSHRLSWAEFESLITATTISGHRMYSGEGSRPNTLTYILTLNGAALSRDMAQRAVVIKLDRSEKSGDWQTLLDKHIDENRDAILADLAAFLRAAPTQLATYSRWGQWDAAILAKLPEPSDAQKLIEERQAAVDVDAEEGLDVEDYFAKQLRELLYSPEKDVVFLPSKVAVTWLGEMTGERRPANTASKKLTQMIKENLTSRLELCPGRALGRGFRWRGADSEQGQAMKTDVEHQIEIRSIGRDRNSGGRF